MQLTDFSEDGGPLTVDLRCFLPKAALRPGMFFAGIASADVLRRLASNQLASLPPAISRRITSRRSRTRLPPKAALRPGVVFASLASRHDPLPALRPLMLLSAMRLILERFFIAAKRALRPRTFLRASLPRASEHHFPPKVASLPDEVGLATRHVLRRHCVRQCSSAPCV